MTRDRAAKQFLSELIEKVYDGSAMSLVLQALARAGWLHGKDELPSGMPRPGRGPLALRVALETGAGSVPGPSR